MRQDLAGRMEMPSAQGATPAGPRPRTPWARQSADGAQAHIPPEDLPGGARPVTHRPGQHENPEIEQADDQARDYYTIQH
jgi:hypothetical protein